MNYSYIKSMTISSYIKMWNSLRTGTLYLSSLHVSFIQFLYRVIHKLRVVSRTFSLQSEYNQCTHQTTCDFSVSVIGMHEKLLLFGFSSMHCVRKTRRFQRKEVKDIVSVYYISSARFESYIHSTHSTHDTYKTKLFISRQNF